MNRYAIYKALFPILGMQAQGQIIVKINQCPFILGTVGLSVVVGLKTNGRKYFLKAELYSPLSYVGYSDTID